MTPILLRLCPTCGLSGYVGDTEATQEQLVDALGRRGVQITSAPCREHGREMMRAIETSICATGWRAALKGGMSWISGRR